VWQRSKANAHTHSALGLQIEGRLAGLCSSQADRQCVAGIVFQLLCPSRPFVFCEVVLRSALEHVDVVTAQIMQSVW
jgi:hypothetical protein